MRDKKSQPKRKEKRLKSQKQRDKAVNTTPAALWIIGSDPLWYRVPSAAIKL